MKKIYKNFKIKNTRIFELKIAPYSIILLILEKTQDGFILSRAKKNFKTDGLVY